MRTAHTELPWLPMQVWWIKLGSFFISQSLCSGCRSIEHASFIDEEGVEACLRNDAWIVPTFLVGEYFLEQGSATGAQDRTIQLMVSTQLFSYVLFAQGNVFLYLE